MIPVKLRLENFMSYRKAEIDFSDGNVILLFGENGSGKSTIFEAITWALWKGIRGRLNVSNVEVIRKGERRAFVSFDFIVDGRTYRVTREAVGTKTALGVYVLGEDGNWHPLRAPTMHELERRIKEEIISMDYATFRVSSLFAQGESGIFTSAKPSERIEYLKNILNLGLFESCRELARDRRKAAEISLAEIERALTVLRDEVQREKEILQKLSQVERELRKKEAEKAAIAGKLLEMSEDLRRLSALRGKAESISKTRADIERSLARARESIEKKKKHLKDLEERLRELGNLEDLRKEREKLEAEEAEQKERELREKLSGVEAKYTELKKKHADIEGRLKELSEEVCTIQKRVSALRRNIEKLLDALKGTADIEPGGDLWEYVEKLDTMLKDRKEELREQAQSIKTAEGELREKEKAASEIRKSISSIEGELRGLDSLTEEYENLCRTIQELEGKEKELAELVGRKSALIAHRTSLEREVKSLRNKISILERSGNTCPLCKSPLTEESRQNAISSYREELKKREEEMERLGKELEGAKNAERDLTAVRARLRKSRERRDILLRKIEKAKAQKRDIEEKRENLMKLEVEMKKLREVIEKGKTVFEQLEAVEEAMGLVSRLRESLKEVELLEERLESRTKERHDAEEAKGKVEKEIATLEAEIKKLKKSLEEVFPRAQRLRELRRNIEALLSATKEATSLRREIAVAEERFREEETKLKNLKKEEEIVKEEIKRLLPLEGEERKLRQEIELCEKELRGLEREKAGLEHLISEIERKKEQMRDLEERRRKLIEDAKIHSMLEEMFGKRGVILFILESILPELQEESNRVLSKLTNGELYLEFAYSGLRGESLDIRVRGAGGERPYYMLSGGEKFRVDFAIRLGLASLLAGRSGKRLESLFIDEGFGSQDERGIDRLLEVIGSIRDMFRKIFVITHVDRIKESGVFDCRFLVVKTEEGSVIRKFSVT